MCSCLQLGTARPSLFNSETEAHKGCWPAVSGSTAWVEASSPAVQTAESPGFLTDSVVCNAKRQHSGTNSSTTLPCFSEVGLDACAPDLGYKGH